jgi:hypothetical protein
MKVAHILPRLGLGVALILTGAWASAGDEQAFINLFAGSWAGPGTLMKASIPWPVTCRATGQPAANQLAIEGNCSLSIISVRIAADITFDPATGRYSGTYIGAKVGPARVFGKRNGSVVNLAITWPKLVHGDTKARMTIENAGRASLRITIFDNVAPRGPEVLASDIILSQTHP